MKDTKYHLIEWADVGCPNCGFNRKVELLCPVDINKIGESVAFSICWQCHYVGQIAVGQVSRRTKRAPDLGQAQPIQSMKPLPQAGKASR